MASFSFVVFTISWFVSLVNGDLVLQEDQHCGSSVHPKEERIQDIDEFSVYSHSGRVDYSPNKNCILTIIGKRYHQWEITLTKLDVDRDKDDCRFSKPPCCNDYLKIFNSYRVDNARLFPSIPWWGLCGNNLPRRSTFTSTQNYITIQFNANPIGDYKTGFALYLRQYPRRSSGSEFSQTGFIGGWNDGTLSELQIDWSQQETIPGDFRPGEDPTFEFDPEGISCYECKGCKRDYFKTSSIGVIPREGCHVCTKEWLQGSAMADRNCLSSSLYQQKLRTLRDTSGGRSVTDYRGCKTFLRGVEGTNYINLCVCDSSGCNKGRGLQGSWIVICLVSLVSVLFYTASSWF